MKKFATIASITNHNKELDTLVRFISSKIVNRCNRSKLLLEMRKPTVACRLSASVNFGLDTPTSRQTKITCKRDITKGSLL